MGYEAESMGKGEMVWVLIGIWDLEFGIWETILAYLGRVRRTAVRWNGDEARPAVVWWSSDGARRVVVRWSSG
ncbi:hypothetical protein E2542_SST31523 [Spatholobus suberectus]|nr:hypothetical protein E2542_SST31523 [Spatholobus suberectus]